MYTFMPTHFFSMSRVRQLRKAVAVQCKNSFHLFCGLIDTMRLYELPRPWPYHSKIAGVSPEANDSVFRTGSHVCLSLSNVQLYILPEWANSLVARCLECCNRPFGIGGRFFYCLALTEHLSLYLTYRFQIAYHRG